MSKIRIIVQLFFVSLLLCSISIGEEKQEKLWSLVYPDEPKIPEVDNINWVNNSVDSFILEKIESQDLQPSERANKHKLVRRAYLDLLGIPPTIEEVKQFTENQSPNAWEELIEELLSSPRYGERWGRHWLDVARYSDSNGMDENIAHPEAYRYRDYVIKSFNQDKPFNQFIIEQLAGDLLPSENLEKSREQTIASGFLSVGPKMLACDDPDKMRRDIVDEQLDTTGRAFMGMTFGCARCHDHKFDPISIEDYYGLAGIFMSTKTLTKYTVVAELHHFDMSTQEVKEQHKKISNIEKKKSEKGISEENKKKLDEEISALKKNLDKPFEVMSVTEYPTEDLRVHLRGDYQTLGNTVPRRLPPALAGMVQPQMPSSQSGRLELARWIASDQNPLTSRVIVNRIWRWHFGRGIVSTPDNYGELGERPSHPNLLDHLALQFIHSNWSIKSLHRLIMNSATYQQSSSSNEMARKKDPDNKLFARWKIRRLESESIRDSVLSKSKLLDLKGGGSMLSAKKHKYANRGKLSEHIKSNKRTIYLPVMRSSGYDGQNAFDFPDPALLNGNRKSSTVTPQALFLMNSDLIHRSSTSLANIILEQSEKSIQEKIKWTIYHLLSRPAEDKEIQIASEFLNSYSNNDLKSAWSAFTRGILASNEFIYIE
ncbi:MAG: DUF1549 and DUF1553 domain-containing protein [Verrucomicrobiota bacterium]|nr:DUF1549 and DUF1553 domain-containing protein [Verrucomicrobiota bacterium]